MRVVYDKSLSTGARLLYVALDDYAGMKATAWPHQATLAERLGVSVREIQRWLQELARYIERQRVRYGSHYRLLWLAPGAESAPRRDMGVASAPTRDAAGVVPAPARHDRDVAPPPSRCDTSVVSDTTSVSCGKVSEQGVTAEFSAPSDSCTGPEPVQEPDKTEEEPRSIDRPVEPSREEKLTWMLEALAGYPGALARLGHWPDTRIALDCLEIGQWDIPAIRRVLQAIYLRGGRRAGPSESWAWFRTALRNFILVPNGAI